MQFGVSIFHANSISIPEKGEQACLMPPHKPGNTHAKKVMTEEKESVVHSADENVKLLYTCTHHRNVKQSDTGAQCFLN